MGFFYFEGVKVSTRVPEEIRNRFLEDPNKFVVSSRDNVIAYCQRDHCQAEIQTQPYRIKRALKKYGRFVCKSCCSKENYEKAKDKLKRTCIEKYGVWPPVKSQKVKDKARKTCLERYGIPDFTPLARKASRDKFNGKNPFEVQEIKNRISQYWKEHPNELKEVHKKRDQTIKEKYGVDNIKQLEWVKEKAKNTNIEKYGPNGWIGLPESKNKVRKSYEERYGKGSWGRTKLLKHTEMEDYESFCRLVAEALEYYSLPPNNRFIEYIFQCSGTTLIRALRHIQRDDLVGANSSGKQDEFAALISKYYFGPIIEGDRKLIYPKEVDIYLPEQNMAFEFNGVHWHSEKYQDSKNIHVDKLKLCQEKRVTLYTIFEHEWDTKREQIEKFVKRLLYKRQILDAEELGVTTDIKQIEKFMSENHIEEEEDTIYFAIGLTLNGQTITAMTVSHKGVINRICFGEYQIRGGLEKMLQYVPFDELTLSTNNRWDSECEMYQNAGFELVKEVGPDYFYTYGGRYYSKQSQSKNNTNCPENLTEKEWASQRGFHRVWDCGKRVWKYKKPKP